MSKRKFEQVLETITKRMQGELDDTLRRITKASLEKWEGCYILKDVDYAVLKQLYQDNQIYDTIPDHYAAFIGPYMHLQHQIKQSSVSHRTKLILYEALHKEKIDLQRDSVISITEALVAHLIIGTDSGYVFALPYYVITAIGSKGATFDQIRILCPYSSDAEVLNQVGYLLETNQVFKILNMYYLYAAFPAREGAFIKRLMRPQNNISEEKISQLFEIFVLKKVGFIVEGKEELKHYETLGLLHLCHDDAYLIGTDDEATVLLHLPAPYTDLKAVVSGNIWDSITSLVQDDVICPVVYKDQIIYHAFSSLATAELVEKAQSIWCVGRADELTAMFYPDGEEIYDFIKAGGQHLDKITEKFNDINQVVLFEEFQALIQAGRLYHRDNFFRTTPFTVCKYGEACYRTHNREHMAEYIHEECGYAPNDIIGVKLSGHRGKYKPYALISKIHPAQKTVDIVWFYHETDLPKVVRRSLDSAYADESAYYISDHEQMDFPIEFITGKINNDSFKISVDGMYTVGEKEISHEYAFPRF